MAVATRAASSGLPSGSRSRFSMLIGHPPRRRNERRRAPRGRRRGTA
ncbi:hypothetical protein FM114_06460 [Luteococcus japonicus LSP_Lj1]|uniref:Uncharacterized protein n=1 Tax=Luteococcus japonicus LSP_Lj1 TaxID=1255658 RepID=A0A1R4JAF5_9ACTN|nr:hypothetical protein FM114_06460 [Luteococcus japonicus LSP_Lj1]